MADSISTLLQLLLMAAGGHGGDWGDQTNTNLQKLETAISGQTTVTVTGGTVTLSDDQARPAVLILAGTLVSDLTIVVPARSKTWAIINATGGAFNSFIQTATPLNTASIPQNATQAYATNGQAVWPLQPIIPVDTGKISMFGGATAPLNHLLCFGQAVSRTTYAALFAVIGTLYGAGDGTTTFNLPDMRGRVPVGLDNMGGSAAGRLTSVTSVLGATGGEQSHLLTSNEIPSHTHGVSDPGHGHGVTDPAHVHTFQEQVLASGPSAGEAVPLAGGPNTFTTNSATTGISIQGATTGITINAAGGGLAHNNVQPMIFLNYIIRI